MAFCGEVLEFLAEKLAASRPGLPDLGMEIVALRATPLTGIKAAPGYEYKRLNLKELKPVDLHNLEDFQISYSLPQADHYLIQPGTSYLLDCPTDGQNRNVPRMGGMASHRHLKLVFRI